MSDLFKLIFSGGMVYGFLASFTAYGFGYAISKFFDISNMG